MVLQLMQLTCLRNQITITEYEKSIQIIIYKQLYLKKLKNTKKILNTQQLIVLYSTPQILIIQLKRFKSSDDISQKIKNNIFVKFPHILNISKYVTNLNLPNDYLNGNNKNELKYKLYGVINHYGDIQEGHYNSLIKNLEDQKQYCYDDSQVKEIQVQDIITQNAYVLCYERQN